MSIHPIQHKPVVATALALCCALALAGCQSGTNASANPANTASTTPTPPASALAVEAVTPPSAPATVVQLSGRNVVVAPGASTLKAGTLYEALRLGAGADAYSAATPCCAIEVDRVAANRAYGHIVNTDFHQSGKFVPGSIELRAPVPLQGAVDVTAKMVAAN